MYIYAWLHEQLVYRPLFVAGCRHWKWMRWENLSYQTFLRKQSKKLFIYVKMLHCGHIHVDLLWNWTITSQYCYKNVMIIINVPIRLFVYLIHILGNH